MTTLKKKDIPKPYTINIIYRRQILASKDNLEVQIRTQCFQFTMNYGHPATRININKLPFTWQRDRAEGVLKHP